MLSGPPQQRYWLCEEFVELRRRCLRFRGQDQHLDSPNGLVELEWVDIFAAYSPALETSLCAMTHSSKPEAFPMVVAKSVSSCPLGSSLKPSSNLNAAVPLAWGYAEGSMVDRDVYGELVSMMGGGKRKSGAKDTEINCHWWLQVRAA